MSGQPVSHVRPLEKQPFTEGESARFLIVDDEPALLRAMRRVLHAAGPDWDIVCARHGLEALEFLSHEAFDVVVLDLHMPVMDGVTLLRHLVAEYPDVRRIVHSSYIDPLRRPLLAELAHEVLAKPVHPRLIVDALERALVDRSTSPPAHSQFQELRANPLPPGSAPAPQPATHAGSRRRS